LLQLRLPRRACRARPGFGPGVDGTTAGEMNIVISTGGAMQTKLLADSVRELQPGGLLFVYGSPPSLAEYGVWLSTRLVFKYWIALDIDAAPRRNALRPAHRGLLLFWKPGKSFR